MEFLARVGTPSGEVLEQGFAAESKAQLEEELEGKGYPFIGGLRPFRDCQFTFVHPKAVNGVLLELIDDK